MTSWGCDNENHRRCILDLTFPLRPPSSKATWPSHKSLFRSSSADSSQTDCHQPVFYRYLCPRCPAKVAIIDPFGVIGHGSLSRVTGHGSRALRLQFIPTLKKARRYHRNRQTQGSDLGLCTRTAPGRPLCCPDCEFCYRCLRSGHLRDQVTRSN